MGVEDQHCNERIPNAKAPTSCHELVFAQITDLLCDGVDFVFFSLSLLSTLGSLANGSPYERLGSRRARVKGEVGWSWCVCRSEGDLVLGDLRYALLP